MTLEIRDVSVSFGPLKALSGVSFDCHGGEILGVIGPNGAGKSTLLKVIAGVWRPDEGNVLLDGAARVGGDIGYLPQRSAIDWDYPAVVNDVVTMGRYPHLGWLRRLRPVDRAKVADALDRMGLTVLAERPIRALSGGQQQRVFVARALAQEPRVLLLDEPFAGIDAISEQVVWEQLWELRAAGVMIIVVNHDLGRVARSFDRLLLLSQRVVAIGHPDEALSPVAIREAYGALPAFLGVGTVERHPDDR